MRVIWKFPLEIAAYQTVEMPGRAEILHVAAQGDTPCIWALVEPTAVTVKRRIMLCVTGTSPEGTKFETTYLGTFQLGGGGFVGHLYDAGVEA